MANNKNKLNLNIMLLIILSDMGQITSPHILRNLSFRGSFLHIYKSTIHHGLEKVHLRHIEVRIEELHLSFSPLKSFISSKKTSLSGPLARLSSMPH